MEKAGWRNRYIVYIAYIGYLLGGRGSKISMFFMLDVFNL